MIGSEKVKEKTLKVTLSGLLHDIGKPIYRAGIMGEKKYNLCGSNFLKEFVKDKDIIDAVKYHRKSELLSANISINSPAYITYIADTIASGADFREIENNSEDTSLNKMLPCYSIFNVMNGRNQSYYYRMNPLSEQINYPEQNTDYKITSSNYSKIVTKLKEDLNNIELQEQSVNSLLTILESNLSFVPSSTYSKEVADISLFDHCKITAAIGSCISEYLQFQNVNDYKNELLKQKEIFLNKKAFLMYSGGFSGIQNFIFNVDSENALKKLRSRSFYLEILMEHVIDEIIDSSGISRTNLIYSGGGRCYILLPNTQKATNTIDKMKKKLNEFLRQRFGTNLYFSSAYVECSANELMNQPYNKAPYEQIFHELNERMSEEKLHKYSAVELIELNRSCNSEGSRECKICGTQAKLCESKNICKWCDSFEQISNVLLEKELVILVSNNQIKNDSSLHFPSLEDDLYFNFMKKADAINELKKVNVKRIYTKNHTSVEFPNSIKLYMGDYVYDPLLENLVDKDGMNRISVLRADVDNLGQAFTSGFTREINDVVQKNKYNTISRTASFSRNISMFFKYYLNFILEDRKNYIEIDRIKKERTRKKVVIVYAGGDDVFLIGNWRDILESAIAIQTTFKQYTSGALKISFGIGLHTLKYPMYKSASEVAELEDLSKQQEGKNSISLFDVKQDHTYQCDVFRESVIGQKLKQLQNFFDFDSNVQESSHSFLYRLLELLQKSDDKINIARYAYILAKMEPKKRDQEYQNRYKEFSENMYRWILNPKDRKEIITALCIYSYLIRKRSDN